MYRNLRRSAVLAFLSLSCFLPLAAQGGLKVLVMDAVISPGLDAALSEPLSDYVLKALMESGKYTVLDRRNIAAVLKEQEFQLSGLVADEEVGKVGAFMGAQAVVVPRLARLGDTWFLSARMIDVETGVVRAQCALEKSGAPSAVPAMGGEAGRILAGQPSASVEALRAAPVAMTLSLTVMDDQAQSRIVIEDAIGRFRASRPEVAFDVKYASTIDTTIRDAILWGEGSDLTWQVSNQLPHYAARKVMMPLEGIESLPGYDPRAAAVSRYQGKPYGFTVSVGDNLFLLYRSDLIPSPPDSMEGILALAKDFGSRGVKPLVWATGDTYVFAAWMAAYGTDFLDGKGRFALKSSALRSALKEYGKDIKAFGIAGYDYMKSLEDFRNGKAAMFITGDWALADLYARNSSLRPFLGARSLPALGKGRMSGYLGGRSLMAKAGLSREKEVAAREFMAMLGSPEIQKEILYYLNRIPSSSDPQIKRIIALDPLYGAVDSSINASRPWPPINAKTVSDGFWGMDWFLAEFSAGRKPLAECADSMYQIADDKLR